MKKKYILPVHTLFDKFKFKEDTEELATVVRKVDNGVVFRGTNLWILIFAIFVASLGLNINSAAVIIGAMLISPLMGPIIGIGLGVGINDLALLRKAVYNFFIATGVALTASTLFFLVSPLNEAHSELLARTSPTIYDVLIALFGGFAGIVATTSRQKGNVLPGVAIATALMPPLCTAGYGLATLQPGFFYGAFYLFIINTVFIGLATFIFARVLYFPLKQLQHKRADTIAQRVIWVLVLLTLLPSIYFGYDMIQQDRFKSKANLFISNEAHFPNDYLLNRKIVPQKKHIELVFGGKEILPEEIAHLRSKLKGYGLEKTTLEIKQGFAYLSEAGNKEQPKQMLQTQLALEASEKQLAYFRSRLDSIDLRQETGKQLFKELKIQYPVISKAILQPSVLYSDQAIPGITYLVLLTVSSNISRRDNTKMEQWIKLRLAVDSLTLIIQR